MVGCVHPSFTVKIAVNKECGSTNMLPHSFLVLLDSCPVSKAVLSRAVVHIGILPFLNFPSVLFATQGTLCVACNSEMLLHFGIYLDIGSVPARFDLPLKLAVCVLMHFAIVDFFEMLQLCSRHSLVEITVASLFCTCPQHALRFSYSKSSVIMNCLNE